MTMLTFNKERLIALVKDYRLWIIFAMILFTLYLMFGNLAIHTETDIQFDQVTTDTFIVFDTL